MSNKLTAIKTFHKVVSREMTSYDAIDFEMDFNTLFKATLKAMEEFSNAENKVLKEDIDALKSERLTETVHFNCFYNTVDACAKEWGIDFKGKDNHLCYPPMPLEDPIMSKPGDPPKDYQL